MKKEYPTRKELAGSLLGKRTQLDIGVREAAKSLGVSPATYSRMENAKPMTLENYIKAINWTQGIVDKERSQLEIKIEAVIDKHYTYQNPTSKQLLVNKVLDEIISVMTKT